MVRDEYGSPGVLHLEEVDAPTPRRGEVLVRVLAAGINPGDWDVLRGTPRILRLGTGLRRPRRRILGAAIAGRVEAVGLGVSGLGCGDAVYAGLDGGGLAELVCVTADRVAAKPSNLSFEQAAAVPVAGVTALQAIRDVGEVRAGQAVLINGASGGVGTFAVQIAKSLGAEVTGVCSTTNVELVRSIGADHVIDYTREDFVAALGAYDVILDNVGNRSLAELRRALRPRGILIPNSNKGRGRWLGPYLRRALHALALSPFVSQRIRPFASSDTREALDRMRGLIERGEVTPVVECTYPLGKAPEALERLGAGHARGKIVISMETA